MKHLKRFASSSTWCGERIELIETRAGSRESVKSTTFAKECTCLRCLAVAVDFHEGPATVTHMQMRDELEVAQAVARNLEHARGLARDRIDSCLMQLERVVEDDKSTNPNERVVIARDMARLALDVLRAAR